jgi:hypothetical protein
MRKKFHAPFNFQWNIEKWFSSFENWKKFLFKFLFGIKYWKLILHEILNWKIIKKNVILYFQKGRLNDKRAIPSSSPTNQKRIIELHKRLSKPPDYVNRLTSLETTYQDSISSIASDLSISVPFTVFRTFIHDICIH